MKIMNIVFSGMLLTGGWLPIGLAQMTPGASWSDFTIGQKDMVVDQLKEKINQIDADIKTINKSNLPDDTKKADINTKKQEIDQVKQTIKKVKDAKDSDWTMVRSEAQDVYNQANR